MSITTELAEQLAEYHIRRTGDKKNQTAKALRSLAKERDDLLAANKEMADDLVRRHDRCCALAERLAAAQAVIADLRQWQHKAASLVYHSDDCLWITTLPTGDGVFGCTCGASDLVLDGEPLNETNSDDTALRQLLEDAARYRWLRDAPATQQDEKGIRQWLFSRPVGASSFDDFIDEARK